uniref:p450 monooxygenase n=1 Tax=Aciculosporium take TaxID=42363 RepID=J7FI35_9HYPO|nr:P450 monooxygenase [Aciculosporium take]
MFLLHLVAAGAGILWYLVYKVGAKHEDGIPTIRCWPAIFPKFFDRLSYNRHAVRLVRHGYEKYKHQPFRLLKMDMDLVVIPLKYALELRAVTSDKLDPLTASFGDNAGKVTNILLGSELHTHAIQRRLNPRLAQFLPILVDELNHAFGRALPLDHAKNGWISVNPYATVLDMATRASARLFVSEPICRNDDFVETSASYSRNVFRTISTSRSLGHSITPYLGRWISTVQEARRQMLYIQNLLLSEIGKRKDASQDIKRDDFLQWCIELARTEEEAEPMALGNRTLGILSMAVVHTTAMATTHMLFDMIADQGLQEKLRKEQELVLKDGWASITQQSMLDMKQLDSLMRESQRVNPVGEFTFRRLVRSPVTLSDGFQLQPGQQIGIAARCINTDTDILPDADLFMPLRWTEQESTVPTSFANSSAANLHFGLGRYACPGRFFAAYLIKAITSRILLEYDFKLKGDFPSGRPPNTIHGDKILPNHTATILLRRRNGE